MRLPARTEEGVQALVRLLAPRTQARVTPHSPRPFSISHPLGFYDNDDFLLDGYNVLGDETTEISSQLLIALNTDDIAETQGSYIRTLWSCCGSISGGAIRRGYS